MSSPTRWAGIPLTDRKIERRGLLIDAAFGLFGDGGESAVSVRSVCRECALNTRYFYESFADTDELLGAVYDMVAAGLAAEMATAITAAGDTDLDRASAGIRAVLGFSSADPRRGRALCMHLLNRAARDGHTVVPVDVMRSSLAGLDVPDPAGAMDAADW